MKLKLIVLSAFFFSMVGGVFSQQNKAMSHFMYDKMSLNPGSTGSEKGICGTLMYRNNWDKVNGAPNSALFNAEANLDRTGLPIGVGLSFYHDAIGFTRQNNLLLNFAWHQPLGNAGKLGAGIGVGFQNLGYNPNYVTPSGVPDPTLPASFSAIGLDLNFGIYWKGRQNYYVGVSAVHLSGSELRQKTTTAGIINSFKVRQHYYLMGGYKMTNGVGQKGALDFNFILRTDLNQFSPELNVRYIWDEKLYGGISYRNPDAVGIMLGARPFAFMPGNNPMKSLLISYSYDITVNKLAKISRGAHEILLKYCYYLPPVPVTKWRDVRHL